MLDGKVRVAQYCQWDGYPSGQGSTIVNFLNTTFNRDKFITRLNNNTKVIDSDEFQALWTGVIGTPAGEWVGMADSKKFAESYPTLQRDMGGHVLEFIQEGQYEVNGYDFSDGKMTEKKTTVIGATDPIPLQLSTDFQKDDLFCEWSYKLDLDTNELIVYGGGLQVVRIFNLAELYGYTIEQFADECDPADEESDDE